jgi:(4S)-4-hydroxy-5-phosphonooxypentane-2,3-dione isomerase
MAKQAVLVEYRVQAGHMDKFLARLRDHIARTRSIESGCVQFDLLRPHKGENTVHLYEVYEDQAAFDLHNGSDHLARYKSETESMLKQRIVKWCVVED